MTVFQENPLFLCPGPIPFLLLRHKPTICLNKRSFQTICKPLNLTKCKPRLVVPQANCYHLPTLPRSVSSFHFHLKSSSLVWPTAELPLLFLRGAQLLQSS